MDCREKGMRRVGVDYLVHLQLVHPHIDMVSMEKIGVSHSRAINREYTYGINLNVFRISIK